LGLILSLLTHGLVPFEHSCPVFGNHHLQPCQTSRPSTHLLTAPSSLLLLCLLHCSRPVGLIAAHNTEIHVSKWVTYMLMSF
jgi:hypothetical protein